MVAYGRRSVVVHGVENADGECLGRKFLDLVRVDPAEGAGLVGFGKLAADELALEDQGDDAPCHVLVDAGQGDGLDLEAGLFVDLSEQARGDVLVTLQDSAGCFPVVVVSALGEECAALVVDDHACHADGVLRVVVIHRITSGAADRYSQTAIHVCAS